MFCQTRAELDTMSLKPGFLMRESSDLNIQVYILVFYPNCLGNIICILHTHTHRQRHTQREKHMCICFDWYVHKLSLSLCQNPWSFDDPPSSTSTFCHTESPNTELKSPTVPIITDRLCAEQRLWHFIHYFI